jgi:hypothetical protein
MRVNARLQLACKFLILTDFESSEAGPPQTADVVGGFLQRFGELIGLLDRVGELERSCTANEMAVSNDAP